MDDKVWKGVYSQGGIMSEIVATNVIASGPTEYRPTGMLTARANTKHFIYTIREVSKTKTEKQLTGEEILFCAKSIFEWCSFQMFENSYIFSTMCNWHEHSAFQ